MSVEITSDIKAKVFIQYIGQYITPVNLSDKAKLTINLLDNIISNGIWWRDYKLILKPLSSITDEHVIEVERLGFGEINFDFSKYSYHGNDFTVRHIKSGLKGGSGLNFLSDEYNVSFERIILIYHYLQSQGYDLPNYHLNGKTLKEAEMCQYEK